MCRVICLRPYAHFLTARFPKVTINLQFVRTQTPQIIRAQGSYPRSITFSLDFGLPSHRFLFAVDRASHVRLLLERPLQSSWRIPESPFGTGIRLSLLLRLVYG